MTPKAWNRWIVDREFPRRRRMQPVVEGLEGRRLLAASTIASTVDGSGQPVLFQARADGSVVVNLERATNDPITPIQETGIQTLSGLSASSIAAFTDAAGEPAVVAMTGPESYLYVDRYANTGDPANPQAWTGWQQLGNFVATSVAAASSGTTGSAVFAIGADTQVYEDAYTPSGGTTSQFSGFQPLPGFSAASISVTSDFGLPNDYEVVALGGPQSYVSGTRAIDTNGTISSPGWAQLGNFVATSINLTPALTGSVTGSLLSNGGVFLFAVGTDTALYSDPLEMGNSNQDQSTTYTLVGGPTQPILNIVESAAVVSNGYYTVYALTGNGYVSQNEITATGLSDNPFYASGWTILNDAFAPGFNGYVQAFSVKSIAATPTADGGLDLVVLDNSGVVNELTAAGHNAIAFPGYSQVPNNNSGFSDLATQSYHPITTAIGPDGLPVVLTLGNDGSVYANRDIAAGTSGASDTYAGFEKLSGLTATSITASPEPNGLAVFALTGAQSEVFENQYRPTGDPAAPYAWTGWQSLGTTIATAIGSATPTNSGPTVFALGLNQTVYAAQAISAVSASSGLAFSAFAPLPGLAAASLSVKAVGPRILVASLTGPQSYAYANLYSPATDPTTNAGTSSGWTLTGTYVLLKAVAGVDSTGSPVVSGVSPTGIEGVSFSLDGTNPPQGSSTNYHGLNFDQLIARGTAENFWRQTNFATFAYPGGAGDVYLTFIQQNGGFSLTNPNGIYLLPTTSTSPGTSFRFGPTGFTPLVQTFATSPDDTTPALYFGANDGQLYVSQGAATNDPTNPYSFSTVASLGAVPG